MNMPNVITNLFKEKEVKYLITWVGGFSEVDTPAHKWNCSKIIAAPKSKDINKIVAELRYESTKGAYGRFELKSISIVK